MIRMLLVSMLFSVFCCPLIAQAQLDEAAMMATAKGHYQEGGFYYASTWLERILRAWPGTAQREEILLMMAKSYAATGREDKAARTVKTLLKDYPQAAVKLDPDVLKLGQEPDAMARPVPALPAEEAPAQVAAAVSQKEQLPEAAVPLSAGNVVIPVAAAAPALAQPAAPSQGLPDAARHDASISPAEPVAVKEPDAVKASSSAEAPVKPEAPKPAVTEPAKPAVEEAAKPAVAEAAKPAVAEPAKPAVEEAAKPAVAEPAKPAVEEAAKPAVAEAVKPAVTEPAKPVIDGAAKPAVPVVATPAPAALNPVALSGEGLKAAETETACRDSSATAPGTYAIELGEFIGKNALAKGKRAVKKAGLMPVVGPGRQKVEVMLRILVGEFTDEGAAKKVLNKLRKAGAEQFMLKDKQGTFRIYAGSYFEHQAALDEQKRLLGKGFPTELKEATVPVATYVINAGCFETEEAAKGKLAELERLGMKGQLRH